MSTAGAVNAVNVIQSVAPVARQGEGAPETPFNQVLSREIAERRGGGREPGASQPQPNAPARAGQAQPAAKSAEVTDAKPAAVIEDEAVQAVDAASAEMLALVSNLVQAAGLAADPNPQPAAAAAALDAARGGRRAADPALLARVMPRGVQAQDAAAADQQAATAALPADAADALVQAALPQAAATQPASDPLPAALPEQARAALAADPARPAAAPAGAELKAALQAAAIRPQDNKPAAATEPGLKQTASDPAALPASAVAAPAEPALKPAPKPAGADAAAKPVETNVAAAGNAAAPAAGKPTESAKTATPVVELTAAKPHEAAPQPAAPAAMSGQVQQAHAFMAQAVEGNAAADKLSPRVGTPAWDQALGQKVVWMVAGGVQSASLTLNPPDLGPLQVVLNVSNSQADASFIAAQPETRQALEASMPRLREMLAESGIQLGQSTVSAGTHQQQYGGPGDQPQPGVRQNGSAAPAPEPASVTPRPAVTQAGGNGLVDTFA